MNGNRTSGTVLLCIGFVFSSLLAANAQRRDTNSPPRLNWVYQLDRLEKYRDSYGAIHVKQPDVWGRARLTEHQGEFESQMASQLGNFVESLHGSRTTVDQSSFASSGGLAAAVSGAFATVDNPADQTNSISIPTNALIGLSNLVLQTFGILTNTVSGFGTNGLRLEPTEILDQRARYLNHLHELRRINEGDDIADAPGYSMYLVRVPISIMPGSKTSLGYGAEVSLKAKLEFPSNFTRTTMRRLVINDLVQQLGTVVEKLAAQETKELKLLLQEVTPLKNPNNKESGNREAAGSDKNTTQATTNGSTNRPEQLTFPFMDELDQAKSSVKRIETILAAAQSVAQNLSHSRKAPFAFPIQDTGRIFGETNLIKLALEFQANPQKLMYFGNIQDQLEGAYDYVASMPDEDWNRYLKLPKLIRERKFSDIRDLRRQFYERFESDTSTVTLLTWPVLVESLLLNARLQEEIKDSQIECPKDCNCKGKLKFYSSSPSHCANSAFEKYVEKRWPIHVFTIDPIAQDQNIADTLSIRRQFQMAVALAVATGKINANQAINYMKAIGKDFQTIALNRTVAGFVEGPNRFGWRFSPRFQAEEKRRKYSIEPGSRECVVMLILPSFVPKLTLESRSRWFSLERPYHTEPEIGRLYSLSEEFKRYKEGTTETGFAVPRGKRVDSIGLKEDESKLVRILEDVESLLPLQTLRLQVPFENTLGGFALLNDGVTALAPQIYGVHGTVVLQSNRTTSVYLIGNNFSIRGTRVIAGGREITNSVLLSRQVILVPIPDNIYSENGKIAVQVATPYGVTAEEFILVSSAIAKNPKPEVSKGSGYSWENPILHVEATSNDQKKIAGFRNIRGNPDISVPSEQLIPPSRASFAFRFSRQVDGKKVPLKGTNVSEVLLPAEQPFALAHSASLPKINFSSTVWPEIAAFLTNNIGFADLPTTVWVQSHQKLDTEAKEHEMDNLLEIRIYK